MSDNLSKVVSALILASKEFKEIKKEKEAYNYSYAPLEVIKCATEPALSKNGLRIIQFPISEDNKIGVETILAHESGAAVSDRFLVQLPKSDPQSIGSALTYFRRYGWLAVLGLAPEDEDDDAVASMPTVSPSDYVFEFGKFNGRKLSDIPAEEVLSYATWLEKQPKKSPRTDNIIKMIRSYHE